MLYNDYLKPVIDRLPASTAVKKALDSEEVLLLIHEHLDELTRVFWHYGEETTSTLLDPIDMDSIRGSAMMNLQQFITLSTDFDFFGPIHHINKSTRPDTSTSTDTRTSGNGIDTNQNNDMVASDTNKSKVNNTNTGKDEITLKDVRQIFSASQHDTTMNDVEIQFIKDDSHKETMVFAEYIEAIVRLGFLKYPSSSCCFSTSSLNDNDEHKEAHEHHQDHHFGSIRLAIEKVTSKKQF